MKRLAIIVSHPIQYYAPVFKLLTERGNLKLKVFYARGETFQNLIPDKKNNRMRHFCLQGYEFEFLKVCLNFLINHQPSKLNVNS